MDCIMAGFAKFGSLQVVLMIARLCLINAKYQQFKDFTADEVDCPTFDSRWITHVDVPWGIKNRAYFTIPPELYLANSTIPEAGDGIFASSFIAKYTWLDEYEGTVIIPARLITEYAFQVMRGGLTYYHTDGYDLDMSNWTRWMNCARNRKEENVQYIYCKGRVYLMTIKDIHPGQELMFYYGHVYAKHLGIYYKIK